MRRKSPHAHVNWTVDARRCHHLFFRMLLAVGSRMRMPRRIRVADAATTSLKIICMV